VENAVKHGALRRGSGGVVGVRIRKREDSATRLVCSVEDNGPGTEAARARSEGFGLHVVRRRLELKYRDAALSFRSAPTGTEVTVELPMEVESSALDTTTNRLVCTEKPV
jgi:LytS/YehU family sensor histidine kinase